LESAVRLIERLNAVKFRWKDTNQDDLGFIAEEVSKIIPEAVYYNSESRVEGIRIVPILAIVVEAIKELNDKVENGR